MSAWTGPWGAPIQEQARAKGLPPPPDGVFAADLRRAGFDVPPHVADATLYVEDADSPTGYKWRSDVWEDIAWWLALDAVSEGTREAILRNVNHPEFRAKIRAHAEAPATLAAGDVAAFVVSLPEPMREAIYASADGALTEASRDAQTFHRALWLGLLACCDLVSRKFAYRLAT